jgi:CubicO group peptidase (beta-lactamase class C family)
VPPKTLVSIGRGVPHTWTACPPGLDLQRLGLSDERIVSVGQFLAVFQYDAPTSFFPTRQTEILKNEAEYQRCEDLHSIRIPEFKIEDLIKNAWFVWGRGVMKASDIVSSSHIRQQYIDPRFSEVQNLLKDFVDSGEELGASIAVNFDGKTVVDIWGGYKTQDKSEPWTQDTIVNVFSTTKTICALVALILVDRGLLDINEKVCKYWPKFAANGKEDIEVRHILSHTSGLSGWEIPMTLDDLCGFEATAAKLADQGPWWDPGSASGYHSWTYGFLIGKLVRLTTGKSLKEFVVQEVAGPLGVDFEIGCSEQNWSRISPLVFPAPPEGQKDTTPAPPAVDESSIPAKTFGNPALDPSFINTHKWREAELGSANGHGSALSVATILSSISLGGLVKGVCLLSQKTIDLIFQEQSKGIDLVTGMNVQFGVGFALAGRNTDLDWLPNGRVCTWGGYGGSIGIMDLDRRLTISYTMNKLDDVGVGSARTKAYVKAIYNAISR